MKLGSLLCVLACAACGGSTATPDAADNCPADTPPASPTPPAPRSFAAGGWDQGTTSFYVFGGDLASACGSTTPQPANDTWRYAFRCTRWIQLAPMTSPPARSGAASVVEIIEGDTHPFRHLYVFGGRDANGQLLNDLWALDLDSLEWAQVMTTGTPPDPREHATLSYNHSYHKLLLFGGNAGTAATPDLRNDVWELAIDTMNTWTQLTTAGTPPPARMLHSAAYVDDVPALFVSGGIGAGGMLLGDLYGLNQPVPMMGPPPNNWVRVTLPGPSPRFGAGMAVDNVSDRLLVFGGNDGTGPLNDLWTYSGHWSMEVPGDAIGNNSGQMCQRPADYVGANENTPERRMGALFMFAPSDVMAGGGIPFLFGGTGDCGALNDVWGLLEGIPPTWQVLEKSDTGVSCAHSGKTGCTSLCQ